MRIIGGGYEGRDNDRPRFGRLNSQHRPDKRGTPEGEERGPHARGPKILPPTRPGDNPRPVEPDGRIGDGAGPLPEISTRALGEEDGGAGPIATTLAIGEEDGGGSKPPDVTTLALGEEDGGRPPVATTLAIGEEDGGGAKPPDITTLALGEEDGGGPPVATTLAIGEEDGGIPFDPPLPFPKPKPWPGPIGGPRPWPKPVPIDPPKPRPIPKPIPVPPPERVQPPKAEGSYRLGGNRLGARFLNFNGDGTAEIRGTRGTKLRFDSIRIAEDGSIFGEWGSGRIKGRRVRGGVGFKLSIAPNDAGYTLQVKAFGRKFDIQASPNGIVPPGPIPPGPIGPPDVEPPGRGGGLLFLYALGENALGATNVTLNTDGTGTITGPGIDIRLSGGGYDEAGNWVAMKGKGIIDGERVRLKRNENGNVFVASGDGGLADRVSAWIRDGRELDAKVIAVAQP